MEKLKYQIGSFIKWCDEYYQVLSNSNDYIGSVKCLDGVIINTFYFKFEEKKAELIIDENKILELEKLMKEE